MSNTTAPKKKMKKRTKFTIFAVLNLFWYTIAVLVLSFFDKNVPAELTAGWFAAWTVELALLYGIKVKSKDDTSDYSDYDRETSDFYYEGREFQTHDSAVEDITPDEDDAEEETTTEETQQDDSVEDQILMQTEGEVSDYDKTLG